jgi:hypothetical protein
MRCENCHAEIGFWTSLRQSVPYRFHCFRCNARYKVSAPFLHVLFILAISVFAGMLLVFRAGLAELGFLFIVPFTAFMVGVWFVIEFILYRHIAGRGRLIVMEKAVKGHVGQMGGATGE